MPLIDEVHRYDYGSRIKHILRVEVNDEPADPGSLALYILSPSGVQTGPIAPTKEGKGFYSYQKTYTAAPVSAATGTWSLLWMGVGSADGAKTRQHYINSTAFNV